MKKMWKRFVSLLLACTLLAGMLPLSASAAVSAPGEDSLSEWVKSKRSELTEEGYTPAGPFPLQGSDLYQYTFTKNQYDSEGNLTQDAVYIILPGIDAANTQIPDYEADSSLKKPWGESNASAVYIADGVTGIGNHAFDGMTTLETLEIEAPTSLKSVGDYAFNGCDKLVGPLDLSGVTDMGKYAFNGCERLGSGEDNEGVTLSDELTTIPENAFNTCGLKNVNIPKSCTKIEKNAFAHNSLSEVEELVLPNGLVTIGESAFVVTMGSGETGIGITSLTIPSTVTSIGTDAFSGRRNLQTVTVEDDGKEGAQLTLGHGAFGTNEFTAYSEQGSITDAAGTTYHGLLGTTFYLPADLVTTFRNGENCFTGDISPMEYVDTVEPTCTTNGYHIYRTTISGAISGEGQPVVVTYHVPLPMLGHDWDDGEPIPPSCERNSYTLYTCKREGCGDTYSDKFGQDATDHEYTLISVTNPSMGNGQSTTFKWECQKSGHDETRDGKPITVEISVSPSSVSATTTTTYGELQLPKVNGGTLSLAADVKKDELLEIGDKSVHVVYTPNTTTYAGYTGMGPVDSFNGTDLVLQINVSKTKLDFSSVRFGNCLVGINPGEDETVPIEIEKNNLPDDVQAEKAVYTQLGSSEGSITPPSIRENWTGTVSVRFTYDPNKYEEETKNLPEEYTYSRNPQDGTVTITHSYAVTKLEMQNVSATAIPDLEYTGSPVETVHVYGIPAGSTVSWEWVSTTDGSVMGRGSAENKNSPDLQIAEIKNAGTYKVTITIQNASYEDYTLPNPVTVNIQKAKVETPEPKEDLVYTSHELTGLVSPDENAEYAYKQGSKLAATDAGTYTATAVLGDTANYEWTKSDNDNDGEVVISWTIAKRPVIETSITRAFISVLYDGNVKRAVSKPTNATNFFTVNYVNGTLIGKVTSSPDEEAFTIKHAEETNAGTYEVIATITDFNNFYWQNHSAVESYSLGTWTINPLQIAAPTITAEDATYTGEAYAGQVTLEHSKVSDSRGSSQDIIDLDKTKSNIRYYTQATGGTALENTPVNAGAYYAGVENWVFEKDKSPGNYTILGGQRGAFTISKAPLTLTAPIENLSVTYTGSDQTVPPPTVEGLQGDDTASDYSLVYTYTIGKSETSQTQIGELKLSQVGTYHISVSVSQECTNYTSNTVKYDFTISTANQTVELTGDDLQGDGSADAPYTISKTLGNDPFTVTGKGYVNDVVVNEDDIGYEVTGGDTQNPVVKVDPTSGEVTLLRAGSATITVTAEGSANYQEATASYTITVGKGTPEVAVQMPTGGSADHTYPYTGKELSFTAAVTGAPDAVEPVKEEKVSFKFYQDNNGSVGEEISGDPPTKIGTYWVEAVYEGDDNYNEATSTAEKFTISPAALEVEAKGYTDTYDGDEHDPASITVTGVGGVISSGYTISYAKKTDGQTDAPDADSNEWKPDTQVKDVADSGDYWFKVVINEDDSYNAYIGSVKVTINPKPLTVTKTVKPTKEYDGTTDAKQNVKFTHIDTDIEGETVTANLISAVYNSANANVDNFITITYELAEDPGTDTDLANYSLDGKTVTGAEMSEKVTDVDGTQVGIDPAPITVAINDQEKVYDGSVATPSQSEWSVDEGKLYDVDNDGIKDNLGITLSVAPDSKNAGTYAITGKWTNKNYEVTFTGSWTGGTAGTYTIDHRPISVQIGNAEGFYGDAPVLDNVELVDDTEDGVSDAGLVDGEVLKNVLKGLELATAANAQSDISDDDITYSIYAKKGEAPIQAPTQLGNYNVTFTNEGTYTVKQRPITITIEDHSSVYGEKIDGGIADPVSDKNYTVAITGNATTGDAIVNNDVLTVTLETTASAKAAAGTYDITGSAEGNKVNNYAITWAGNGGDRDDGGKNGKYTIKPAQLEIAFTQGNQVTNGVSINITDSYKDNPLVLKNASTNDVVSEADKETLDITYSIAEAGENGGSTNVATINEKTGEVTILKTGTVRITATVTPQGNSNYTGQVTTWYELNIIGGGQMALMVTPKTNLTYTGEPQALIETPNCSLEGATIKYSLNNQDWKDTIPTGINAGNYTVYVKATDPSGQYSDVTEHVTVTIAKATLEGSFAQEEYTHVLTTGTSYDSATANELTIRSAGYGAEPAKYTYRSANTTVAMAENGGSTIRIMGSAGQETTITVTVPGDDNYNEGTFTYKLKISDKLSEIKYNVTGTTTTYNGQPRTIAVNVTEPASGATVMYWNESTDAYDLSEPPAYTDVRDGGYTIKFQITAPGYEAVTDEATLKIEPKDISQCKVEGIAESYTYVGHQIQPETVAVVDDSVILTKNTDYTLEYGANQEVGEDTGTVTIKGKGNYTGKVTEYFDIIPVDGSSGITASIAPNFGTYDPDASVTAEVTVTHQTGSDSHNVDLTATNAEYTISATDLVTGQAITDHGATGTGDTLTFTKPAIYDITLTLTGDHQGEFRLSYTLLPLSNDDGGLTLTVDDETQKVFTYGGEIDPSDATIKVTANNTDVTDQCTLTYVYTPFEGTPTTTASPYTAEVLENAGVYTVTATPTDGSAITGTGTFTFLILQRDLSEANLTVEDSGLVYNQNAQTPSVTVTVDGNAQPTKDTDYTITYYNNVNASDAAKAVVTAKGNNFTGSQTAEFTIAPKPITAEMVDDIPDQHYTGEEVVPPVTITDGNYTLILGYDYTTACTNKGPGAAKVTITGTGNYTGTTTKDFVIKSEGAPEPSERFDLAVTPSQWTWGDDLKDLALSVTFGTGNELTLGKEYTLEVNGQTFDGTTGKTKDDALTYIKSLKPSEYTITATGVGAYNGSTDTETVTIQKIQPTVTVTATPNSLSDGGKVTLTLKGEKLPAFAEGEDLSDLLTVKVQNGQQAPNLTELEWTENQDGSLTAELTLPNTNETYTFTLSFVGNDYYESASSTAMVVVAQQIISGGGGGPVEDQPADPDDTGVSDWLNTKDHLAYLAGYPGGTFGPDQNMTRAEAAQMFYNLLLEKDVEITVEFEDVPAGAWYATPVNTLASLGILSGVGNGRFDPERSITRAEFTVIAMKFANTSGGGVNIFSDVNEDDWFYSAVVDSTQYGWINGYPDGTFRPEATISRAEVTVIVNHMLGRAADRPYVIAHEKELNTFGDVNRGHWGYFHIAEATNAHEYHTEDGTESWTGLS